MTNTELSEKEVVEIIKKRLGQWVEETQRPDSLWPDVDIARVTNSMHPHWFTSRDALAPVLEKLHKEEWHCLCQNMTKEHGLEAASTSDVIQYCLTIDHRTLTFAIARAIRTASVVVT